MDTIVVYSPVITPRLRYVADWILGERLQLKYRLEQDKDAVSDARCLISYGQVMMNSVSIASSGLLSEKGVQVAAPPLGKWDGQPTIYAEAATNYSLPFDIFSAVFYLITRYEEYYAYTPDKHGRYPATNSILHKNGWLQRPIVDEWIEALRLHLQDAFGINIARQPFRFRPTYDIDMAYSHLHKGIRRIAGAYVRALLRVDLKQINLRTQVLRKKKKDPYDAFRWMRQMHKTYGVVPLYFILSAARTTRFDKNIHPQHPAMVRVIKNLVKEGTIGIHPSYYSGNGDVLLREKAMLEQVAGSSTNVSRQHYIKATMPGTYRMLLASNIAEDYTMGYGTHLGFRAGTGSSFLWYDIENESVTALRIFPFCFMDTTARYEMQLTTLQAFEKLQAMTRLLEQTGSLLITVFHNFSLGTDEEWRGWRQAYELFVHNKARR